MQTVVCNRMIDLILASLNPEPSLRYNAASAPPTPRHRLMSTDPRTILDDERTKWSPWAIAAAILLLLIFGVIAVGTLRGCFFVDPQEAAKIAEEKKKKEGGRKEKEDARLRSRSADRDAVRAQGAAADREAGPLGNRQPGHEVQLPRLRRRLASLDRQSARTSPTRSPTRRSMCAPAGPCC